MGVGPRWWVSRPRPPRNPRTPGRASRRPPQRRVCGGMLDVWLTSLPLMSADRRSRGGRLFAPVPADPPTGSHPVVATGALTTRPRRAPSPRVRCGAERDAGCRRRWLYTWSPRRCSSLLSRHRVGVRAQCGGGWGRYARGRRDRLRPGPVTQVDLDTPCRYLGGNRADLSALARMLISPRQSDADVGSE